jgi:hypothetical protein
MAYTRTARNDHMAEHCRDELCPRLPCQMFKALSSFASHL